MESWRTVFREGFAPLLSDAALAALKDGLERDDQNILQGATTKPPPLMCVQDWPVEGGCPLAYGGWKGDGLVTVEEVETYWARLNFDADSRLGEVSGGRWFLNWVDDTPREEMRSELLAEVYREIDRRADAVTVRIAGDPFDGATCDLLGTPAPTF
jgi:hypothetical protein